VPASTSTPVKRIQIYGHVSASPSALAKRFSAEVASEVRADADLAIFAINPAAGIDEATINCWRSLDDFQTPRMLVVTGLDGQDLDFEDAVILANRVLDTFVTPYLVLHGDDGEPAALIRLQDLEIIDYSTKPPTLRHSEPEHEELVREFREEYFDQMSEMDEGAFAAGILFPAIPINIAKEIGLDIVDRYIESLPSSS
jgi:translation elongation factor EF-G